MRNSGQNSKNEYRQIQARQEDLEREIDNSRQDSESAPTQYAAMLVSAPDGSAWPTRNPVDGSGEGFYYAQSVMFGGVPTPGSVVTATPVGGLYLAYNLGNAVPTDPALASSIPGLPPMYVVMFSIGGVPCFWLDDH